ncbi:unnamed protein product [Brassicogethes aeneus]|uniref:Tudor domain-containing protein n=1 Tax=Brassicogethes aeneus TaxID=1431903 RepID=A0A9P0FLB8_BRAAE|nr:unnamed protein product [Brassicogethes aeneus]
MAADILGAEWHLSPAGINLITDNGNIKDRSQILKKALDTDLKEIGGSVLSKELTKDKTSKMVLQIQKIRNISAPKANEESQAAPRMLKLILTDGETSVQAIELSTIQQISREKTAPGTKVLVNGAKISSGFLLFNNSCVSVLGGKVPHLIERWELAKSVQKSNRQQGTTDGPPPWVNFGCKIQAGDKNDAFKSLQPKTKDPNKDDTEFEQQRQKALAEASSGAVKKVFGGRVKEQVQPVVNRNLNNNTNNNRRNERRGFKGRNLEPREVDDVPQKPLEKVSLFDFLETKLPVAESAPKGIEKPVQQFNYQKSNYERKSDYKNAPRTSNSYSNAPSNGYNNFPKPHEPYSNKKEYQYNNGYNNYTKPNEPYHKKDFGNKDYGNKDFGNKDYGNKDFGNKDYGNKDFGNKDYGNKDFGNKDYGNKDFGNKDYGNKDFGNKDYGNKDFGGKDYANNQKREHKQPKPESHQQQNHFNPKPQQEQKIEKNLNDIAGNMSRLSLGNSNFASKIIRQQLNIAPNKKPEENLVANNQESGELLAVGNECLAKYWEDGKFYNAVITAITPKTYVVKFRGYDNIEEILKKDCQAINKNNRRNDRNEKYSGGSMEFHRGRKIYSKN